MHTFSCKKGYEHDYKNNVDKMYELLYNKVSFYTFCSRQLGPYAIVSTMYTRNNYKPVNIWKLCTGLNLVYMNLLHRVTASIKNLNYA